MPNPRAQKNANLRSTATGVYDAITQGLLPMIGNAARGSLAATGGFAGDTLGLLWDGQPFPTSQGLLDVMPAFGKDKNITNMAETMGGFIPTPGAGAVAKGAGRAVKTALNPMTYGRAFMEAQAPAVMSKIFIGEKAKTWDKAAAEAFKKLEAQGVGNKEAWQQTGTFRSPDGKLRQEIDDKSAFYPRYAMPDGRRYGMFEDVLLHPELQKAYPDITRGTQVGVDLSPAIKGEYIEGTPATKTNFGRTPEINASGPSREKIKPTLLHEAQHAIQEVEGFGSGGSPNLLSPLASSSPEIQKNVDAWSKFAELMTGEPAGMKRLSDFDYVDDFLDDTVPSFSANFDQKLSKQDAGQLKGLLVDAGFEPKEVAKEISAAQKMGTYAGFGEWIGGKMRDRLSGAIFSPRERYELLPGEIEARLVERRMNLTPEQRRQYFPLDQGQYGIDVDPMRVKELEDAQRAYSKQFQMVPYNRSLLAD